MSDTSARAWQNRADAPARAWLVAASLSYVALSLLLFAGGHQPSRGVPWWPREMHYGIQAMLLPLVVWAQWQVVARVLGRGGAKRAHDDAARAIAWPLLGFVVLPDFVVLAAFGFDALGALIKVSAPLAAFATGALLYRAMQGTGGRRVGLAVLGVVLQTLLAALVVR